MCLFDLYVFGHRGKRHFHLIYQSCIYLKKKKKPVQVTMLLLMASNTIICFSSLSVVGFKSEVN